MKILEQRILAFFGSVLIVTGIILPNFGVSAQAVSAHFFLAPASATFEINQNITVQMRLDTKGVTVSTVTAEINYDASAFDYVGIDATGSAFPNAPGAGTGGGSGTVYTDRFTIDGANGNNLLIASVTFKAKKSSGTSGVTFSNNSAAYRLSDGSPMTYTKAGGTYTMRSAPSPPPTPPSTPTNPTPPSTPTNPTPTPTQSSSPVSPRPVTNGSSTPAPVVTPSVQGSPLETEPQSDDVQFTKVKISWKTTRPVTAQVLFGFSEALEFASSQQTNTTTPSISLPDSLLSPGVRYYYKAVMIDADGSKTESGLKEFTTRGYTIRLKLRNGAGEALRKTPVTLFSEPQNSETDNDGIVEFTNVAPGTHEVEIKQGDKTYKQEILVAAEEVREENGTQTADEQEFTVEFKEASATAQASGGGIVLVIISIVALLLAAAIVFILLKKRGGPPSMPMYGDVSGGGYQPPASNSGPTIYSGTSWQDNMYTQQQSQSQVPDVQAYPNQSAQQVYAPGSQPQQAQVIQPQQFAQTPQTAGQSQSAPVNPPANVTPNYAQNSQQFYAPSAGQSIPGQQANVEENYDPSQNQLPR